MKLRDVISRNKDFLRGKPDIYFSPGRVNLIGEHIDYLGGNVFPAAIDLGTYAFVTRRFDDELHFLSENFKDQGVIKSSIDDLEYKEEDDWASYCKGMFHAFKEQGITFQNGYNILIFGTLPNGAGLSSSASLEVLIGEIIVDQLKLTTPMVDLVQMAQKVENEYIGVNCGIMDQFAVGMGKKDHAVYLNTDTLEYEYVPVILKEYTLIIANTNKRRSLSESRYNERRQECDLGLLFLQGNGVDINQLCDMNPDMFHEFEHYITDHNVKRRVKHAVYENHRTKQAVKSLKEGKIDDFGFLMTESHDSLRNLFEVSCKELDILVEGFQESGAIGTRMTGAGFGGCVISLVPTKRVKEIIEETGFYYYNKIGYKADFYPVHISDGTSKIKVVE